MPTELDLSKWPRWALITAAVIGMLTTGAVGTWAGSAVMDHEIRLTRIESLDIKADVREIKMSMEEVKRDVAVLKARTP